MTRRKPSALRLLLEALSRHFFPAVASAGFTVPHRYPMYEFGDSGEMYSGKLFEFFQPSELACLYCGVSKEREPELIIRLTAARFDGNIESLDAAVERVTLANEMAHLRILSPSRAPLDYLFVEWPLGLFPRPW